jgi:hypothetical protein
LLASFLVEDLRELPAEPSQVHWLMELDAERCAFEELDTYVNTERIRLFEAKECILEPLKQNNHTWYNLQRWRTNAEQSVRGPLWENKLITVIDREEIEWARWGDHGYERGTHDSMTMEPW